MTLDQLLADTAAESAKLFEVDSADGLRLQACDASTALGIAQMAARVHGWARVMRGGRLLWPRPC